MSVGQQVGVRHHWSRGVECEWTGEPHLDLSTGVFRQAVNDAKKGDEDAVDWLVSEDGAVLWLRALGFGIRPSMRERLRELALDKSYKV